MKKLVYNVYFRTMSDDEYIEIRDRLSVLEAKMSDILLPMGWQVTMPVRANDALVIDFTTDKLNHRGNVGLILYIESKEKVFSFYVTKGFDVGNVRYFLRDDVFRNKPFDFFENNIDAFLKEALKKYDEWTDEQIIELGEQFSD